MPQTPLSNEALFRYTVASARCAEALPRAITRVVVEPFAGQPDMRALRGARASLGEKDPVIMRVDYLIARPEREIRRIPDSSPEYPLLTYPFVRRPRGSSALANIGALARRAFGLDA